MNDYLKIKTKTKTCLKLLSSFKLKGRESKLCTQNYWSEALLTLNLQSTWNGRFSWFACLPPDWQWRQSHFHSSWYFRAFSRGRSEDCSTSLSLQKMSGILMEIYCCLPKPYLLLTCHNVASAFLQASGECGSDPTGGWLYRAWGREEPKRNWAKSSRPCSGKNPRTPGDPGLEGDVARFTTPGYSTAPAPPWSDRQWDFWWSKDWKNRVSRLLSLLNQRPCIYWLNAPVCSGGESPALSRIKGVGCWGDCAGKLARPPCATPCSP